MLKSLLNHTLKGDVTDAHYDQSYKDPAERMKAAEKIQQFILRTGGRVRKADVVQMEARRA